MQAETEREKRARAATERLRQTQASTPSNVPSKSTYKDYDAGLWDRLEIRRNLNTILEKHGVRTLKTLLAIAKKILENDQESKYKRLGMESDAVKRKIVEPAGVKEVVIDMGFRKTETIDHQEYRIWLLKYHDRLRLYKELLEEVIIDAPINEARRDEDLRIRREREENEDSKMKALQRFRDDRVHVREQSQREKQARIGGNSSQMENQVSSPTTRKSARICTLSDISASAKEGKSSTEDGDEASTPRGPGSAV